MDRRSTAWRPRHGDVLLAAAVGLFAVVGAAIVQDGDDRPWWPGGAALIVAGSLVLVWRQRAPLPVLALTLAAVAPYYWSGYPDGPVALLVVVAMYTVASRLSWHRSVAVGLALLLVWVGLDLVVSLHEGTQAAPADRYVWIVVTVAVGVAVGGLRRAHDESAERAEEQARRRVEQERLRIARSVHDVVSHSLASIAVQAGIGAHVADRRPEQAVAALLEIKEASRAALEELRSTLEVLREGAADEATEEPWGLHRLDEITRVAGLAGVGVEVRGDAGTLGAQVDDAAFRIVREAVTNVVRHGRDAHHVVVDLERDADELRVRVADDGRPPAEVTPGHGLRGLAEHAAALGGHSAAGPGPQGFVVQASLPLVPAP